MYKSITLVNAHFNTEIREVTRKKEIAHARQVYLFCMKQCTKYSLSQLAESVNLKNHATVLHAIKTIKNELTYDKVLVEDVSILTEKLSKIYKERVVNYNITENDYALVAIWLRGKGVDIDIENPNWKKKNYGISVGTMIDLIIKYNLE